MRIVLIVVCCCVLEACGGGSDLPTVPSPTSPASTVPVPAPFPPPTPTSWTGTVTDTITGAAISSYSARLAGSRLTVSAPGYITRETNAGVVAVDLIPEAGFDLDFYRQFARNSFDLPIQPLRVLTAAPMFYVETEGAKGFPRPTATLLEQLAHTLVPILTGGKFQVARWETGPTPRAPEPGWIVIDRYPDQDVCGRALVGASAGHIWLNGDHPSCVAAIRSIFAHELGHALGFWHVNRVGAMMFRGFDHPSSTDMPTDVERRSATIAYARPRGNTDIDVDP